MQWTEWEREEFHVANTEKLNLNFVFICRSYAGVTSKWPRGSNHRLQNPICTGHSPRFYLLLWYFKRSRHTKHNINLTLRKSYRRTNIFCRFIFRLQYNWASKYRSTLIILSEWVWNEWQQKAAQSNAKWDINRSFFIEIFLMVFSVEMFSRKMYIMECG